jgi:hypothetical protein
MGRAGTRLLYDRGLGVIEQADATMDRRRKVYLALTRRDDPRRQLPLAVRGTSGPTATRIYFVLVALLLLLWLLVAVFA